MDKLRGMETFIAVVECGSFTGAASRLGLSAVMVGKYIAQLESQLNTLPEMLPEIASKSRIGILAGVDWDAGVREEAQAAGLYTASIHDEIFALTTPEGFAPRRW